MAINGFKADGTTYRYNAEALDGYAPIEDGSVTREKIANSAVADNLTTATAGEAVLDAHQGKILNDSTVKLYTGADGLWMGYVPSSNAIGFYSAAYPSGANLLGTVDISGRSTDTLTYASGIASSTDSITIVRKKNGVVYGTFSVGPASATTYAAGWLTLFTTSTGFRPGSTNSFVCEAFASGNTPIQSFRGIINTNGTVQVFINASTANVVRFIGQFTFVL